MKPRRMHPSGSKIHRVWRCQASAILPRDSSDDRDARTEPARNRGKEIHAFLEVVKRDGREAALSRCSAETRLLCEALDLDKLPAHLSTEVAYAWNWRERTARELGRNLGHRDYHLLPEPPDPTCEIPCTVDVCGVAEIPRSGDFGTPGLNGPLIRGYVGDYKTGRTKYPRPQNFGQTLLGAACVRSVHGCDDVVAELIYLHDDGTHHSVRDVVDPWLLDMFCDEIDATMSDLDRLEADYYDRGILPPATEGDHCEYCDSYRHCHAKVALVRAMPTTLRLMGVSLEPDAFTGENVMVLDANAITASTAAKIWTMVEQVEDMLGRIKEEVCKLGWNSPIPLPDGRVIERYVTERRELEGRAALAVLERKYGRDVALKAAKIEVPISAVREIVQAHTDWTRKPKPVMSSQKGTGELDKMMAELQAAGAVHVNTSEQCKPHKPKK